MIATDEDALICDLAETYHIFDYRQLPPLRAAVFACGLRENARIMMRLSEQVVPTDTLLMAQMADTLNMLWWAKTEDAQTGKNRPPSITAAILGTVAGETTKDAVGFATGEDFDKARQMLIGSDQSGD